MIQPNELRIGNYVMLGGYPAFVTEIRPDGVLMQLFDPCNIGKIVDHQGALKPIPLTEEWLPKLGLQETKSTNGSWRSFQNKYYEVIVAPNSGIVSLYRIIDNAEISKQINHVHQLQNLYIDLTGEELTLNIHQS